MARICGGSHLNGINARTKHVKTIPESLRGGESMRIEQIYPCPRLLLLLLLLRRGVSARTVPGHTNVGISRLAKR